MKNKKLVVFFALFVSVLLFSGCFGTNFVSKFGTNITNYEINLKLNDNETISGKQVVNYKNTSSAILNEVYFHLYANSFSETAVNKPVSKLYETQAYPNGKSYGGIEIQNVTQKADECTYSLENTDNDLLKVVLNTPLYPNDFVSIEMEYLITVPNVLHRFGYNDNTINLGNIYPIASVFDGENWDKNPYSSNGDPFYSTLANYDVQLTCNKKYVVACTGNKTNSQQQDGLQTVCINANAVRDFAIVLSEHFDIQKAIVDDIEINYYYYGDEKASQSLETAKKSISTFNNFFGKYPYEQISIVETGFIYGGMEYPNLVMISDNLDKYDDYTNTIVHEIAHQWWYGVVGNNQFENSWLDESLAEYSVLLFYEKNPEYEIKRDVIIQNAITSYTLFVDVYKDIFKEIDTSMNRKLNEYDTEPEYVYAVYVKGLIMFDDIRNIIGDRHFFNCLKKYYKQYSGKIATPDNLIDCFEDTSNKRLKAIFTSYIDGSAIIGNLNGEQQTAEQ